MAGGSALDRKGSSPPPTALSDSAGADNLRFPQALGRALSGAQGEGRGFCPGLSTHRACKTAMRIGTLNGRIHFADRVGPPGWPGWELPPNPESAAENGLLAEEKPQALSARQPNAAAEAPRLA